MTRDDARRLCLRVMAQQLREQGVSLNSEWAVMDDDGNDRPSADVERIRRAAERLAREWLDRAGEP